MKIQQIPGNEGPVDPKGLNDKGGAEGSPTFSALLGNEQVEKQEIPPQIGIRSIPVYSLSCIEFPTSVLAPRNEDQQALEALETVMGHLEGLEQTLLGGHKIDRGEIKASLDKISRSLPGLREELSRLPEEHPLRQIGEAMSVLCYVETTKWNRGDYVS